MAGFFRDGGCDEGDESGCYEMLCDGSMQWAQENFGNADLGDVRRVPLAMPVFSIPASRDRVFRLMFSVHVLRNTSNTHDEHWHSQWHPALVAIIRTHLAIAMTGQRINFELSWIQYVESENMI